MRERKDPLLWGRERKREPLLLSSLFPHSCICVFIVSGGGNLKVKQNSYKYAFIHTYIYIHTYTPTYMQKHQLILLLGVWRKETGILVLLEVIEKNLTSQ